MTTVYPAVGNLLQAQPKPDEEDNVWTRLLSEWGNKSGASGHGSVIVLGEPECGKTTLLRRMTKADKMSFSSALEYSFLNIQSDYNNGSYAYQLGSAAAGAAAAAFGSSDSINLPVFLLSGHESFVPLLKFALPKQLTKACFVLTVSMSPPEKIIPSLEKWFAVAERVVKEHYSEEVIEAGRQARKF
uniref:Dynein light intermediate chain n=1 Tax=Panagrellus redivivus TaxID=6233 RepID=A0A7E4UZJ0_PANRE